jgi:SAM-dependent methyltransferase
MNPRTPTASGPRVQSQKGITVPGRCLLCDSSDLVVQDQLTGEQMISLWKVMGRAFNPEALAPVTPDTLIALFRCERCGFRFYDPSLAGSARFYEELMAGDYYAENRPEFEFTLSIARARRLHTVLDVGGGEGGFLDLAKSRGLKTYGVELNSVAVERASNKGHRMIRKLLQEVDPGEVEGGVDLLTLYQVVEHVSDPVAFVQDASRLVKPGGLLAVSVPNEYRVLGLLPYDPANWPPHHVSRWRRQDLRALARRAGLQVVAEGSDILFGSVLQTFIPLHNRMAAAIGRRPYPVDARGAGVLSFLYRKLGFRHFFPRLGLSIYLIAQK